MRGKDKDKVRRSSRDKKKRRGEVERANEAKAK